MRSAIASGLFLLLLAGGTTLSQSPSNADASSALVARLQASTYPLTLDDGALSGPGRDFLLRAAGQSQFFLVGEEHGIAENPLVAAALLRELKSYRYFAAEIGSLTATRLESAAKRQPVPDVLAAFNRRYPFSLPFFNWIEEGALMATAIDRPGGRGPRLWGLDQEFFFSPVYHFERLRELAPDARARALAQQFCEKTREELARAAQARNPSGAFLVVATPGDFDALDAAFRGARGEARQILDALRESAEIYQKNIHGEIYANNAQRSQLLKRNFMRYYNAARLVDPEPRVFFKFGAGHVARGRSYSNVFDLGNLVSELAAAQGGASFHVLVMAAGGTYNKYLPFVANEADKQKELVPATVYFYVDVRPFVALADSPDWKVVDLRPLRPLLGTPALPNVPRGFADLVTGFDAVVLVREAHPTTL